MIDIVKYLKILNFSIYDTVSSWSYTVRYNLQLLNIDKNVVLTSLMLDILKFHHIYNRLPDITNKLSDIVGYNWLL